MPSTGIIDSYENFEYVLKTDNMYENLWIQNSVQFTRKLCKWVNKFEKN